MNFVVHNIVIILTYSHYPQSYQQLFIHISYVFNIFSHYPQTI